MSIKSRTRARAGAIAAEGLASEDLSSEAASDGLSVD
jgi:hypothetical protein